MRDHLSASATADMEKAMLNYNRTGQIASVPQFARSVNVTPSSAQLTTDLAWTTQAELPSLHRWFQRFDEADPPAIYDAGQNVTYKLIERKGQQG